MPRSSRARDLFALAGLSIGVALGYYFACQVGLRLRIPDATPSILWPPNAVLTSALLLTRPRLWPLVLISALPAHMLVEVPVGWPVPMVFGLFVTNCLEALIAAGGIYLTSDMPSRFDRFPRLLSFLLCAVFAAPFLSSFADAAVVTWFRDEQYWTVWRMRLLSNTLSALAVIPAIVGVVGSLQIWVRRGWPRAVEAMALLFTLAVVSLMTFNAELSAAPTLRAIWIHTPLALQLPILLWAAVRFGPVGTGVAVLLSTLLSTYALLNGHGPFGDADPTTTVTAVTVTLTLEGVTLMCLATLVEERRQILQELHGRLRFEELISRCSGAFVQMSSDQMDRGFSVWIPRIAEALDVDALALFVGADPARPDGVYTSGVAATGGPPLQAFADGIVMPIAGPRTTLGTLACKPMAADSRGELAARLTLVIDVLRNVLTRKEAEDAIRRVELYAHRTRNELAHVARVATVGELTASIAHQLNQPLSAIMTNAQAARRMLDMASPDLGKIRVILTDITADDRRASDIIDGMRKLLRRSEPAMTDVNVSTLLHDVASLVAGEAAARGVALNMRCICDPTPLTVRGDAVQLQQLVLNLLQNAIEAVSSRPAGTRQIFVTCEPIDGRTVSLSVQDSGPGLPDDVAAMFEPFCTTKPAGMGMGLPIVRTIVEAHGGSITASNEVGGGARFDIVLPAVVLQDS